MVAWIYLFDRVSKYEPTKMEQEYNSPSFANV